MFGFAKRTRRRVHICTMTADQMAYYAPLTRWLRRHGYRILATLTAPAEQKLEAARACDLCLLLLGPTPGPALRGSSFTQTEMEVSVARDLDPGKLLVFAQDTVAHPATAEQANFIERLRSFAGGTFQATCTSPAEFLAQVAAALPAWRAAAQHAARLAAVTPADAIMISSTGDLVAERRAARRVVQRRRLPVIDYQIAASESVTPIVRVTSWARTSRALVLILGRRYGYISPIDGLGITELEFVTALVHRRPILAFLRPDALTTDDSSQQQFVARVRHFVPVEQQYVCDDAATLARQLVAALRRLARLEPAPPPRVSTAQAREWYPRHLRRWLGALPVPGQAETIPLTTMILTLTPTPINPAALPAPDVFDSVFIPDYPPDIPSVAPEEALAQSARMVLVGGPGSGKSTVLRWYALQASEAWAPVLPVYISLPVYARARIANEVDSVAAFVAREEQRLLLAPDAASSRWCAALEAGHGLLLLDALDGVPDAASATVLADIAAYEAQLPLGTRIVVAGRSGGEALETLGEGGFTRYDMVPLGAGQQQILVEGWIRAGAPLALGQDDQDEMRRRVTRILYQLRFVATETQWARTPLLLGLFTAASDSAAEDERPVLTPLAGAAVFRRALRALLQSAFPAHLRAKEAFLQALASQLRNDANVAPIAADALARAWDAVPGAITAGLDRDTLVDALCDANKLLSRQVTTYAFSADSFWSHFIAQYLSMAPERDWLELLVRRRLSTRWGPVLSALTDELDRQGRHDEATRALETLTRADQAPIFGAAVGDPLHACALKVTYAQGARAEPHRSAEPGPTLARIWHDVWRADTFGMRRYAIKGLYVLGPAAALALDALREAAADRSGRDPARVTFALLALRRLAFYGDQGAKEALARGGGQAGRAAPDSDVRLLDAPLDVVRRGLEAPDMRDRAAAAMQVRKFGRLAQDCVPLLIPLLDDGDSFAVMQAAGALRSMGTAAAPAAAALARAALRDEVSMAADDVYGALWVLGPSAAPAVPIIAEALQAADPGRRDAAISAAGALGPLMAHAGATIIALVLQGDAASWRAKGTLSAIQADTTPLISALRDRLRSAAVTTRREALAVVVDLGELCAPLRDDIIDLADPARPTTCDDALSALGTLRVDPAATLPVIRMALAHPAHRVRALGAIATMGPLALPLADDIMPLLDQEPLRQATLEALVHIGAPATPERTARIVAHLHDANEVTRLAAFGAACDLRPLRPETVRALVETLDARQGDSSAWRYFLRLVGPLQQIVDADMPAGILPG